jgi:hypothetical protein
MTDQDLQNQREWRDWLKNLIAVILLPSLISFATWYVTYSNGTKLDSAEKARQVIETKIDAHTATLDQQTVKLDEAAEHAKVAAVEAKAVAAKINTMGDAQPADAP